MLQPNSMKRERIAIYFDIILGAVLAIVALYFITFYTVTEGINNFSILYMLGLIFWIAWLGLSIFLIGVGIKSYYNEKYFELTGKNKKDRKLKAPMVS